MGFVPELPLFQHHFIFMSLCCPMCFNYIYFYFLNSMSYFFVETVLPGPSYLHKIHLSEQKAYKHKKSKNVLCKNLFKMIPFHSSHLQAYVQSPFLLIYERQETGMVYVIEAGSHGNSGVLVVIEEREKNTLN